MPCPRLWSPPMTPVESGQTGVDFRCPSRSGRVWPGWRRAPRVKSDANTAWKSTTRPGCCRNAKSFVLSVGVSRRAIFRKWAPKPRSSRNGISVDGVRRKNVRPACAPRRISWWHSQASSPPEIRNCWSPRLKSENSRKCQSSKKSEIVYSAGDMSCRHFVELVCLVEPHIPICFPAELKLLTPR